MSQVRIVLFGTGSPLSVIALETLASRQHVVAVVVPGAPRIRGPRSAARALLRRRSTEPLRRLAAALRIPVVPYSPSSREASERALHALAAELFCVASFPWLLKPSLLEIPGRGTLGIHPSLLPRHRGPSPLFWTYFDDDAEAGVTVYCLDGEEDAGDVVDQESVPLARGRPVEELYPDLARRGALLLARAVEGLDTVASRRSPQDESRATREPAPDAAACRAAFSTWGSERVWHLLSGVGGQVRLLEGPDGRALPHSRARGFVRRDHGRRPGTIEPSGGAWRLYCVDGIVEVARAGRAATALWRLRGLLRGGAGHR